MALAPETDRTVRGLLNEANPNKLEVGFALLPMGEAMGLLARSVRAVGMVAGVVPLPDNEKACAIVKAFAVDGATGPLTIVEGVPGAGEVAVTPNGDVLTLVADAITELELTYQAREGCVVEETVDVVASVATPLGARRIGVLLEVEVVAGATPGVLAVGVRGAAPGAGVNATVTFPGLGVTFAAADVVAGTARLKYIAQPGEGTAPASVSANLASNPNT